MANPKDSTGTTAPMVTPTEPSDKIEKPGDRANADWDDDEGENWRHAPVTPKDANPLESLGKAISDTVTGAEADRSKGPKT